MCSFVIPRAKAKLTLLSFVEVLPNDIIYTRFSHKSLFPGAVCPRIVQKECFFFPFYLWGMNNIVRHTFSLGSQEDNHY